MVLAVAVVKFRLLPLAALGFPPSRRGVRARMRALASCLLRLTVRSPSLSCLVRWLCCLPKQSIFNQKTLKAVFITDLRVLAYCSAIWLPQV